jgi:NAD(P)-dependent dehydrogenase (short-subunit alcohol dehydrogenase family)
VNQAHLRAVPLAHGVAITKDDMSGTYLIWGGNSGIGAATARLLAARGCKVHLAGRDAGRLKAVAAETGGGFTVADVTDDAAFARVAAEAGPTLAGLVYAVGSINLKPVARLTAADFERDFRLNAVGAALAVQAALPALKAHEGTASITLFSTVAVHQGFTAHASVAMAKGAVEGLTLALAAELAPKVRVNCIAPSLTRTPLARALTGNEQMAAAIAQMHPLPRLGEPEDAARLAAFLATDDAGWITGQIIGVDGGRSSLRTKG